jgi:hypothetical protein
MNIKPVTPAMGAVNVEGPAGPYRTVTLRIDNCSPRAERLITSICALFSSVRQDEWEHLFAARAALVVDPSGRAQLTYDTNGGNRHN